MNDSRIKKGARIRWALCLGMLLELLSILPAPAQTDSGPSIRFQAVDVYVDSKAASLAAYQLEFRETNGVAKIVGIEGGDHPAFKEAPFYDPKAIQQERVIVAAFNTGENLPKGKTRVATIHLQITGDQPATYVIALTVAADAAGRKIPAEASIEERKKQ